MNWHLFLIESSYPGSCSLHCLKSFTAHTKPLYFSSYGFFHYLFRAIARYFIFYCHYGRNLFFSYVFSSVITSILKKLLTLAYLLCIWPYYWNFIIFNSFSDGCLGFSWRIPAANNVILSLPPTIIYLISTLCRSASDGNSRTMLTNENIPWHPFLFQT